MTDSMTQDSELAAALDAREDERTLAQWRAIALHLQSELTSVSHGLAEMTVLHQSAEACISRELDEIRQDSQAVRADLARLTSGGRHVLSLPAGSVRPRSTDRSWRDRVEATQDALIRIVESPEGYEAYLRLTRKRHQAFQKSKASLPYKVGELAKKLAGGNKPKDVLRAVGRPRTKDNDLHWLFIKLVADKHPEMLGETRERGFSRRLWEALAAKGTAPTVGPDVFSRGLIEARKRLHGSKSSGRK